MRFSKVIGHAALKAKLIGNVREDRIAHAQLFQGPRGSGNLPLALAYARYLLCEKRDVADSCGVCASCLQMDKLEHPDLHLAFPIFLTEKIKTCDHFIKDWRRAVLDRPWIDIDLWRGELESENKQLRMGVDVAQDIQRRLSLRSFCGGYKVMLIWQAELMDPAASNKMLKILEEPEPNTVFILVVNDTERLLATITSRTQTIKVPALKPMEVSSALREKFPEMTVEQADMIGLHSEGDMLEAIGMAEKGEEELFVFFRNWLRTCYNRSVPEAGELAEGFQKLGREGQKSLMRFGLRMIRQCVLQWQQVPELVRSMGEERDFVTKFSKLLFDHNAEGIRVALETAHVHIERNANPKILFMDTSYRLMGLLKPRA